MPSLSHSILSHRLKNEAMFKSPLRYPTSLFAYSADAPKLYHVIEATNDHASFYKCKGWTWNEHMVIAKSPPYHTRLCKHCETALAKEDGKK